MKATFEEMYEKKGRLGRGGFGDVFKVLNKKDNKFYALKCIAKEPEEEKNNFINDCKKEIEIMKKIKSKYIVKLNENFYDENNESYCIIMELCDSDLRKLLNEYKPKEKISMGLLKINYNILFNKIKQKK